MLFAPRSGLIPRLADGQYLPSLPLLWTVHVVLLHWRWKLRQNPGGRLKRGRWARLPIVIFLMVSVVSGQQPGRFPQPADFSQRAITSAAERSEERRVGKE